MEPLIIRQFQQPLDYSPTWKAMRDLTDHRNEKTPDELWLLEHQPVFTQGQAGKSEHILNPGKIPVVQTDRGGQVTYHGPGQLVIYTLFDIKRLGISTRPLVRTTEKVIIDCLAALDITAIAREDAPGIYVNGAKICSIGLRVRRGCAYHGIAFNIDMDLSPFDRINPCGYQGLKMIQVKDLAPQATLNSLRHAIIPYFLSHFGYNHSIIYQPDTLEPQHEPAL
jgi:lipoyl(octanoyl) transferase